MIEKKRTPQPLFRLRTIAVIEVFIAIGILLVINLFYFNGDRYTGITPHPFWFVIILISAQYGVAEGVFAVLISTVAFLVGNVRSRGDNEYLYNYLLDINSQPLLWLISAVILGSLRFRHVMERDRLRNDLTEAFKREEIVAVKYEELRMIREMLEQRLVRHANTAIDTYKAVKLMETSHPGRILEGMQDLIVSLLQPKQFSVYMLNGDALNASVTYAWEKPDQYPTHLDSANQLFQEVIGKKRFLCIADEEDELILSQHHGMLAGPIMSENGQILGMLKIEQINYTDLHISTLQTFRIVCNWIGNAYYQAEGYQKATSNSFISPANNLYSYEFFKLQADYTTFLAKRFNFDLLLMVVKILDNAENIGGNQYQAGLKALETAVEQNLRKIDQIFNYQMPDHAYYILLPGTGENYGQLVTEKISRAFEAAQKAAGTQLQLSFSTQVLYKKSQA